MNFVIRPSISGLITTDSSAISEPTAVTSSVKLLEDTCIFYWESSWFF